MAMNIVIYIACYLSGLFFGTFLWTLLENFSKTWRQLTRRVTRAIPWTFRRIIMWVMILIFAYIGYFVVPWGITYGGIFMGSAAGLFVYLKAGVTLGKSNYAAQPQKSANYGGSRKSANYGGSRKSANYGGNRKYGNYAGGTRKSGKKK